MSAHQNTKGNAILFCNAGSCETSFTIQHTGAIETRQAAAPAGWNVGDVDDRRDFCPKHQGVTR